MVRISTAQARALGLDVGVESKYHNRKVDVDGYTFDSRAEARRYGSLALLVQGGHIHTLRVHPKFDLVVNGALVARYEADFHYFDTAVNDWVTEDVKGVRTAVFVLKKKLYETLYQTTLREVDADGNLRHPAQRKVKKA